jgi:tRNA1Val (adenine37-N6)-methyltransferase
MTAEGEGTAGEAITVDTLLRGQVTLLQPARGFRSSVDPLLLSGFLRPPFGRFVDIGSGTGALAFSLAALDPAATGVAVELQPRLANLATRALLRNSFSARIAIVEADIRRAVGVGPLEKAGFDLVATNPPYRALRGGFVSPDHERARAHHEVTLTLAEWLDAAAALVRPEGRVAVVYDAARLDELVAGLELRGLRLRRLRLVHPRLAQPATRVLVEAAPTGSGASWPSSSPNVVEPPLELRGPNGNSDEMRRILGET